MSDVEIGRITHYFDRIHVAVLQLNEPIKVGEMVRIAGRSTELVQRVESLQIDHQPVREAGPGAEVALRVAEQVREHDKVFRVAESA